MIPTWLHLGHELILDRINSILFIYLYYTCNTCMYCTQFRSTLNVGGVNKYCKVRMHRVAIPVSSVPETGEECGGEAVRNFCSTGRVYFLRYPPRPL